jgi:hypothetical protein
VTQTEKGTQDAALLTQAGSYKARRLSDNVGLPAAIAGLQRDILADDGKHGLGRNRLRISRVHGHVSRITGERGARQKSSGVFPFLHAMVFPLLKRTGIGCQLFAYASVREGCVQSSQAHRSGGLFLRQRRVDETYSCLSRKRTWGGWVRGGVWVGDGGVFAG